MAALDDGGGGDGGSKDSCKDGSKGTSKDTSKDSGGEQLAESSAKLIFAPAGAQAHGQAPQYTRGTLSRRDLVSTGTPIPQFHAWFAAAQAASASAPDADAEQPEACVLSTCALPSGRVSARVVYLKELDAGGGFVVYSNWRDSRKARDLASNPRAALVFHWPRLQRQVRVEGVAARVDAEQSQAYFDTRLRSSRIGAWASRQSQVLEPRRGRAAAAAAAAVGQGADGGAAPDGPAGGSTGHDAAIDNDAAAAADDDDDGRAQLDEWVADAERRFRDQDRIPVPPFWGGLRIEPTAVEFWQGRASRLHDRFLYERDDAAAARWTLSRLSP